MAAVPAFLLASLIAATTPSVEWVAPAGCPGADEAVTTIAAGLGNDSDLQITATVEASDAGFGAVVHVVSAAGESTRPLTSPDCATLLDAVALIAAAAEAEAQAEPDAEAEDPSDPQVPQPGVVEASAVAPSAAEEPAPTSSAEVFEPAGPPPPRTGRTWAVSPYARLLGRIGWGITPAFDGGGGAAVGVQWQRLRVEAFAAALAPGERELPEHPGAAARVFAWSAGVRGCGIVWSDARERVAVPVCGAAEAGQMIGRGRGPSLAATAPFSDTFVAVLVGPGLLARITRWASVHAGLDAVVLARRPGFAIRGIGTVHRPAPVGVRLELGIEFHFPRRIRAPGGMR